MSASDPQMKIRLPVELRDKIAAAAEAAKRSLNAEIVSRLEETFSAPEHQFIRRSELLALVRHLNETGPPKR